MATNGLEAGGFEQAGDTASDPSFSESPAHARGVSTTLSGWQFPTYTTSSGQNWTIICQNTNDGHGNHPTIYQDGTYVAIPVYFGLTNTSGDDWLMTPAIGINTFSIGVGSGQQAVQLVLNLPSPAWTVLTWLQYYGTPPNPYGPSNIVPPAVVAVAKWGSNSCSMRTSTVMQAGTYGGSWGFPSSYSYLNFPPFNPVNGTNSIGGFCRFKLLSADLTTLVDVTPSPSGQTSPMGVVSFSVNSVAALGNRLPFFPVIEISAVPDPGIAQSKLNTTATAVYGGQWTTS